MPSVRFEALSPTGRLTKRIACWYHCPNTISLGAASLCLLFPLSKLKGRRNSCRYWYAEFLHSNVKARVIWLYFFGCFRKEEFGLSDWLFQGLDFLDFIFGSQSDRHELRSTGLIKQTWTCVWIRALKILRLLKSQKGEEAELKACNWSLK